MQHAKSSFQICSNHSIKILLRQFHQEIIPCYACIIDQDIDSSKCIYDLFDIFFTLCIIRNIPRHAHCIPACRLYFCNRFKCCRLRSPVIDDHKGTSFGKFNRRCSSDSSGCSGYYCNFSCQHVSPHFRARFLHVPSLCRVRADTNLAIEKFYFSIFSPFIPFRSENPAFLQDPPW